MIFVQNFDFCTEFLFLYKILIFCKNFRFFVQTFLFCPNLSKKRFITQKPGGDKPVPVDIRLDIPELRKLLSIGFTEDLRCAQSDVVFLARGIYNKPTDPSVMLERVKRIDSFEKATQMKIIRRTPDTNEIDEQRPFLERSVPVTRSPKVSGAGVQLSNSVDIIRSSMEF